MSDWLIHQDYIDNYLDAVVCATKDDDYFKIFKTQTPYNGVVGMSDEWQLPYFAEYFGKYNFHDKLEEVSKNDCVGGLNLVEFHNHLMSINTARYLKTACEIYEYFGPLDGKVISEIGIGYGGLCYVLNCLFDISKYHLIDLPEVEELAQKFLKKLNVDNISVYNAEHSFLTISEYAISELDGDAIEMYYQTVLLNSDYIYLMINLHNKNEREGFINYISNGFDVEVYDEYPKSPEYDNKLIIGKNKLNQ